MQELFTLGVSSGYTERDVREHARALTGWTSTWNSGDRPAGGLPLRPRRHDNGIKVIYGKRGQLRLARQSCDLAIAHPAHPQTLHHAAVVLLLRNPAAPHPTNAPWQTSTESSGKEIRPVVEAMLMHPLFHAGPRMVKPPIVQIAGMLRAIGRFIDTDAWVWESDIAGQPPFYPPNVAGWEMNRWLNTGTWLARFNLIVAGDRRKGAR